MHDHFTFIIIIIVLVKVTDHDDARLNYKIDSLTMHVGDTKKLMALLCLQSYISWLAWDCHIPGFKIVQNRLAKPTLQPFYTANCNETGPTSWGHALSKCCSVNIF